MFQYSEILLKRLFQDGVWESETFTVSSDPTEAETAGVIIIETISVKITESFAQRSLDEKRLHDILNLAWDLIQNSVYHGNNNDPTKSVAVGFWIGAESCLFAFQDEGNFYSDPFVKNQLESRMTIEPSWSDGKEHGSHGTQWLAEIADFVFVDVSENTLYFAIKAKDHN